MMSCTQVLFASVVLVWMITTNLGAKCDTHIITREEWGAAPSKHPYVNISGPVPLVVIHHTAIPDWCVGESCKAVIRAIQKAHFDRGYNDIGYTFMIGSDGQIFQGRGWGVVGSHAYRYNRNSYGWDDIGYNFLVGSDGLVYQGRGWGVVGAHAKGYNNISCGIAVIGNFEVDFPQNVSLDSALWLLGKGLRDGWFQPNYTLVGHRDVGQTLCPGKHFYPIISQWDHFGPPPNRSSPRVI